MNNIKKLTVLFFTLALLTFSNVYSIYANEDCTEEEVFYIETITSDNISDNVSTFSLTDNNSNFITFKPFAVNSSNKTITKTKTSKSYSKNGTLLWSMSIKATFTYNGTTSKCTSYSHSAAAPAKSWKIKSISSSKNGNSATAVGVATHKDGSNSKDYVRSITIKCSKDGVVS